MSCVYEPLHACLDRLKESHWFIHQMEEHYHSADRFRYSLNAYLRSLKEIRPMLQQGMQSIDGFKNWFSAHSESLKTDPLLSVLAKKRDYLVHHGMLDAKSKGGLGAARGKKLKFAMNWDVHPTEDSDDAMKGFACVMMGMGDPFRFFSDDDTQPCIERQWILTDVSDENILDVAWRAWLTVAKIVSEACVWRGGEALDLSLKCRRDSNLVKVKRYDREEMESYGLLFVEGV